MASNKTPNLGMDVWAETDYFKRAELNGNFNKLDVEIADKGNKITLLANAVGENIEKTGITGSALQTLINLMPAYGTIIIPKGINLSASSTVTVNKPLNIEAYGASLTSTHSSTNVLVLQSDDINLYGLKVNGNNGANENTIQVKAGYKNISMRFIQTSGALNGVSSENRTENVRIKQSVLKGNIQGIIGRLPKSWVIEKCIIKDHDVSGGNGIKIQGQEKTVEAVTVSDDYVQVTAHGFVEGDKVRFYGTGTLPTGLVKDTSYYVLGNGLTSDKFKIGLPDGTLKSGSVSVQNLTPIDITGTDLTGTTNITVVVVAQDITIKDNKLQNNRAGIWLKESDNSFVSGNKVDDGTTIQIENSWNNLITKNIVRNAIDLGINLHKNSSYNIVKGNQALNCMNSGIGITIDVLVGIANNNHNVISGNIVKGSKPISTYPTSTGNGIEFNGTNAYNIVVGNKVSENTNYGIRLAAGSLETTVEGNQVYKNNIGIQNDNDGNIILGNNVHSNASDGIVIGTSISFVTVNSNRIKNNTGRGVVLGTNSQFCVVNGNSVNGNTGGNFVDSTYKNNKVSNNIGINDGARTDGFLLSTRNYVNSLSTDSGISVTVANTKICNLANGSGSGTQNYSGLVIVTARQSLNDSANTASYVLHVGKHAANSSATQISANGLTSGGSTSHPSFTFAIDTANNELEASPVGSTSGTFYFHVSTVGDIKVS